MTATESFMSVSQLLHGVLMEQFKSGPPAWVKRRANCPRKIGKSSCHDGDGEFRSRLGAARITRPRACRGIGDRGAPAPDTDLAKLGDPPGIEFRTQRQHRLRVWSAP